MTSSAVPHDVVDFWFDPICGWSWIGSRWLIEASERRPIMLRWHPFALAVREDDPPSAGTGERLHELSKRFVRVSAAVAANHDNDAVDAFYTALGSRVHGSGGLFAAVRAASAEDLTDARVAALMQAGPVIDAALADAGLPAGLAAAMDAQSWDDRLLAARRALPAGRFETSPVGVPMISVNGGAALFGPVVGKIYRGVDAALFWDAFRFLAGQESFFELRRAVTRPPIREYLTD